MEKNANENNLPGPPADPDSDLMVNMNASIIEVAADNAPEPMEIDTEDLTCFETPINSEISEDDDSDDEAVIELESLCTLADTLKCPHIEIPSLDELELQAQVEPYSLKKVEAKPVQDEMELSIKKAIKNANLEKETLGVEGLVLEQIRTQILANVKRIKKLEKYLDFLKICFRNMLAIPFQHGAPKAKVQFEEDQYGDHFFDAVTDEEGDEETEEEEEDKETEENDGETEEDEEETDETKYGEEAEDYEETQEAEVTEYDEEAEDYEETGEAEVTEYDEEAEVAEDYEEAAVTEYYEETEVTEHDEEAQEDEVTGEAENHKKK